MENWSNKAIRFYINIQCLAIRITTKCDSENGEYTIKKYQKSIKHIIFLSENCVHWNMSDVLHCENKTRLIRTVSESRQTPRHGNVMFMSVSARA